MLPFSLEYLGNLSPWRQRASEHHLNSLRGFAQATIEKLEQDVAKIRGQNNFKGLFHICVLASLGQQVDCMVDDEVTTETAISLRITLGRLERLCQWPQLDPSTYEGEAVFLPDHYPILRRIITTKVPVAPTITAFIRDRSQGVSAARDLWFELFNDPLRSEVRGLETAELRKISPALEQGDAHAMVSQLHDALHGHFTSVHCQYRWSSVLANLYLDLPTKASQDPNYSRFRLFLTNSHAIRTEQFFYWWQDVQVEIPRNLVRFTDMLTTEPDRSPEPLSRLREGQQSVQANSIDQLEDDNDVDVFCEVFEACKELQHKYSYSSVFHQQLPCQPRRRFSQRSPSIPLAALIGSGKIGHKMKSVLSYCLIHTLWKYYDTDWISEDWSKETVHFMVDEHDSKLKLVSIHEPFIQKKFDRSNETVLVLPASDAVTIQAKQKRKASTSKSKFSLRTHRYPKILALGIMLLEIQLDTKFETFIKRDCVDPDISNVKHRVAGEVLSNPQLWPPEDIHDFPRQAIEECLKGNVEELGSSDFAVRQNFFDRIVAPYGGHVHASWRSDWKTKPIQLTKDPILPQLSEQGQVNGDLEHCITAVKDVDLAAAALYETPSRPHKRSEFRIAIICALPVEAEMVGSMFDKFWDDEYHKAGYGKAVGDQNTYTTGTIGNHNVVLVYMPGTGNTSATGVAFGLRASFPGIEVAFVVGICGVLPKNMRNEEIVLGDCIVSTAVVQYDYGGQYHHGFIRKSSIEDTLGRAGPGIRSLTTKLKTRRKHLMKRLGHYLQELQMIRSDLQYPGAESDRLFEASYVHQYRESSDRDCNSVGCKDEQLIQRHRLRCLQTLSSGSDDKKTSVMPTVHFGRFGSANTVMKSGSDRDRIAKEESLIAFEMEGSGVWDIFPTIIVKSACDYADSHKNEEWQPYAAATAASALKAILEQLEITDDSSK